MSTSRHGIDAELDHGSFSRETSEKTDLSVNEPTDFFSHIFRTCPFVT